MLGKFPNLVFVFWISRRTQSKSIFFFSRLEEFIAFRTPTEYNSGSVSSVKGRGEKNINTLKLLFVLFWRQSRVQVFESVWKPCISVTCSLHQRKDAKKGDRPVYCKSDCFSRNFPWEHVCRLLWKIMSRKSLNRAQEVGYNRALRLHLERLQPWCLLFETVASIKDGYPVQFLYVWWLSSEFTVGAFSSLVSMVACIIT